MILVTVGNHYQGFPRLIRKMDEIAQSIDDKVIMQIGDTDIKPKNVSFFKYTSQKEMDRLGNDSRIVVTHAGAGSILRGFQWGKPLIVVPRLAKFHEHLDDHQLQLTEALSKEKKIIAVHDIGDLEGAILRAESFHIPLKYAENKSLVISLRHHINDISNQLSRRRL